MRIVVVPLCLFLLMLCGLGLGAPALAQKNIVLLLHGNEEEYIAQAHIIADVLRRYNYAVNIISDTRQLQRYSASRILVVYVGHGVSAFQPPRIVLGDGSIEASELMTHITALERIMIIGACYSGLWLRFSAPNTLIITNCNRTKAYMIPTHFSPFGIEGSIPNLFLIAHHEGVSLEHAFEIWEEQIINKWYGALQAEITPQLYDGIEGEVWL